MYIAHHNSLEIHKNHLIQLRRVHPKKILKKELKNNILPVFQLPWLSKYKKLNSVHDKIVLTGFV